ncbi:MAG: hypothetical protein HY843_08805 [Bdellovibrio sp.]|nr:hypothetical protein [Bdellovibrio sp.]
MTKAYVFNFLVQDSVLISLIGRFSFPVMRSLKMLILVVEGVFLMSVFCKKLELKEFNDALHFFIDRFKKKLSAFRN